MEWTGARYADKPTAQAMTRVLGVVGHDALVVTGHQDPEFEVGSGRRMG